MKQSLLTFVFLSIYLLSLIMCEHSFKTINFVETIISLEHKSRFNEIKNIHLPSDELSNIAHVPLFLVAKLLAEKSNVTNLVDSYWGSPQAIKRFASKRAKISAQDESTSILTIFGAFFFDVYTPFYQWERFVQSPQKPIFVMTEIKYWNFIYCNLVQWEREPVYSMNVLTSIFDQNTWICLTLSLFGMSLILETRKFGDQFIILISAILSSGISGKIRKQQVPFAFFLILIRIVIDMYSGNMSSLMISPPKEMSFKNLRELNNANFSTVTRNLDENNRRLSYLSQSTSNKSGKWIKPNDLFMKKLHERAVYVSGGDASNAEIAKYIVKEYSRDIACIDNWFIVMSMASQIESWRANGDKSLQNGALCHLGTELDYGGPFYWAFIPPNHDTLAKNFKRILESGIFDLMFREFIGLLYSTRVQDRVRVKSMTHIQTGTYAHKEGGHQFGQNQLNNKLAKVFFLWSMCIVACIVLILLELMHNYVINIYV